jgi:hypothetical protein
MIRLLTIIMELIGFALKRGKSKKEKKEDDFDEALAEDNYKHLSGDLSDSFDRVQSEVRRDPE